LKITRLRTLPEKGRVIIRARLDILTSKAHMTKCQA
jgi:hypothetical protein